jgi:hypothetical protein
MYISFNLRSLELLYIAWLSLYIIICDIWAKSAWKRQIKHYNSSLRITTNMNLHSIRPILELDRSADPRTNDRIVGQVTSTQIIPNILLSTQPTTTMPSVPSFSESVSNALGMH